VLPGAKVTDEYEFDDASDPSPNGMIILRNLSLNQLIIFTNPEDRSYTLGGPTLRFTKMMPDNHIGTGQLSLELDLPVKTATLSDDNDVSYLSGTKFKTRNRRASDNNLGIFALISQVGPESKASKLERPAKAGLKYQQEKDREVRCLEVFLGNRPRHAGLTGWHLYKGYAQTQVAVDSFYTALAEEEGVEVEW
jgi:hypothetical protein